MSRFNAKKFAILVEISGKLREEISENRVLSILQTFDNNFLKHLTEYSLKFQ